jgi:hypothetical protein
MSGGPKNVKSTTTPIIPKWLSDPAKMDLSTITDLMQGFMTGEGPGYQKFTDYVNRVQEPTIENYQKAIAPTEMSDAMKAGAFGGSGDAEARMQNQYSLGKTLANSAEDTGFKFISLLGNTIGSFLGPFGGQTSKQPNPQAQSKGL